MPLRRLDVESFRNLSRVSLELSPGFNIISGENGAGKTALLEAIHCLARGRSFLPIRTSGLIQRGADGFLVRGDAGEEGSTHRVVMTRGSAGTRARMDGQDVKTLSTVARLFPIQVITTQSQQLLTEGPGIRRSFLDWAMFHVEQRYRDWWRRYHRTLRQRNVALRQQDARMAALWEQELDSAAGPIDRARREFLDRLLPLWERRVAAWLPGLDLTWRYWRGWRQDGSLLERLTTGRGAELAVGHTLHGPHRADLRLRLGDKDASHQLSRGQQKLVAVALQLAVLQVFGASGTPIALVDDLSAELDSRGRRRVMEAVEGMRAQVFLTVIEKGALPYSPQGARWFHVEQGRYAEMV